MYVTVCLYMLHVTVYRSYVLIYMFIHVYTIVYTGLPCYTMVYHAIPWYTMLFHTIRWSTIAIRDPEHVLPSKITLSFPASSSSISCSTKTLFSSFRRQFSSNSGGFQDENVKSTTKTPRKWPQKSKTTRFNYI